MVLLRKYRVAIVAVFLSLAIMTLIILAIEAPHATDFSALLRNNLPGPFGIFGTVPATRVRVDVVLDKYLYRYVIASFISSCAHVAGSPLALAFDPHDMSLWVVSHDNDSSVIIDGTRTSGE